MKVLFPAVLAVCLLTGVTCMPGAAFPLEIDSPDFFNGESIPIENTGMGEDASPELRWGGAPDGTVSFALVADDPDAPAGTWVHWVIFNIPAGSAGLPGGVPAETVLADGSMQGENSWGNIGYGGPMPPPGPGHRYFFKLYALDAKLPLRPGASAADVTDAMKGHILAEAELMGRFGR